MITGNHIDRSIPALTLGQAPIDALNKMRHFDLHALPVIDSDTNHLYGVITESDLLECLANSETINQHWGLTSFSAKQDLHIFEALRLANIHQADLIPVTDNEQHFVGAVRVSDLMSQLTEITNVNTSGSVITITTPRSDLVLSEIMEMVEKEHAQILNVSTHAVEDAVAEDDMVNVSLKVSADNAKHIAAAIKSLGYIITSTSDYNYEEDMQERANEFLHYLNI